MTEQGCGRETKVHGNVNNVSTWCKKKAKGQRDTYSSDPWAQVN